MELLTNTQEECQRLEVYSEYLKKIPDLLKQLETVEKMYQKAVLEEEMLKDKPLDNHSVQLYAERLRRIKEQCEIRSTDIHQQCTLILELKAQIEAESSVLNALQKNLQWKRVIQTNHTLSFLFVFHFFFTEHSSQFTNFSFQFHVFFP